MTAIVASYDSCGSALIGSSEKWDGTAAAITTVQMHFQSFLVAYYLTLICNLAYAFAQSIAITNVIKRH